MSDCGVTISSVQFCGMTANVVFMPETGGTITLGPQVFPFTYYSDYVYGTYECYVPTYRCVYSVLVAGPTPTPTVSPTVTPTNTPTPSITPGPVYQINLWGAGGYVEACDLPLYGGPANVTIYSLIPWGLIEDGDYVYGNSSCTLPPIGEESIISDGSIWIQVDPSIGLVINTGLCP